MMAMVGNKHEGKGNDQEESFESLREEIHSNLELLKEELRM